MSEFRPPTIVVNFKVYAEAEGPRALTLAKTCQKVSKESGVQIAVCPPMIGLALIARSMDIPVYSQNVDPLKPGSGTGFVTPSMLHSTDVKGTLVNHSEHRQPLESVGTCIEMCKYLSLDVCACAESAEEAGKIAGFAPQMIAVEPPELIGGDVSVTTANPRIVSDPRRGCPLRRRRQDRGGRQSRPRPWSQGCAAGIRRGQVKGSRGRPQGPHQTHLTLRRHKPFTSNINFQPSSWYASLIWIRRRRPR